MEKNRISDLHCHSINSTDGEYSAQALIDRAVAKKLEYFSLTDHNNMSYLLDYLNRKGLKGYDAYHVMSDTKFVPGVEVTCRINDKRATNKKGNPSKIHMLVYSPIIDKSDMFYSLVKLKRRNDISYDFGPLFTMAKLKDVELDEKDLRTYIKEKRDLVSGFSTFGKDSTYEYLEAHYPGLFENYAQFEDLYEEINQSARLNLDVRDVINLAHNAGGLCVLAHPHPTMRRIGGNKGNAIDCLIDYGIDGFESVYPAMNDGTQELIEKTVKRHSIKNPMIYTSGSDFHRVVEWRDLGEFRKHPDSDMMEYLYTKNSTNFAKEIEKLNRAREEWCPTHRQYSNVSLGKLSRILNETEKFVKQNECDIDTGALFMGGNNHAIPEFDERLENEPI